MISAQITAPNPTTSQIGAFKGKTITELAVNLNSKEFNKQLAVGKLGVVFPAQDSARTETVKAWGNANVDVLADTLGEFGTYKKIRNLECIQVLNSEGIGTKFIISSDTGFSEVMKRFIKEFPQMVYKDSNNYVRVEISGVADADNPVYQITKVSIEAKVLVKECVNTYFINIDYSDGGKNYYVKLQHYMFNLFEGKPFFNIEGPLSETFRGVIQFINEKMEAWRLYQK